MMASDSPAAQVTETHPNGVMKGVGAPESLALMPMRGGGRR
jgi:hypothetical protein